MIGRSVRKYIDIDDIEDADESVQPPKENLMDWWGYLHTSGTIQAKRYFGPLDIQEANESPFVEESFGPFKAKDRDDAIEQLEKYFKK